MNVTVAVPARPAVPVPGPAPGKAAAIVPASGAAGVQTGRIPKAAAPNLLTIEQATMATDWVNGTTRHSGWHTTAGASAVARVSDGEGGWCIQLTCTSTPWLAAAAATQAGWSVAPCAPGETVTLMCELRSPDPGVSIGFQPIFLNAAGGIVDQPVTYLPITSAWRPYRATFVAPAGTVSVRYQLTRGGTPLGGSYQWRRAGQFSGDVDRWYSPADVWAANLLLTEQADFETNTYPTACGWGAWSGGQTLAWSTEQARQGTHSLKCGGGTNNWAQFAARPAPAGGWQYWPCVPGRGYSAVLSVYSLAPEQGMQATINWTDAAGTSVGAAAANYIFGPVGVWRDGAVRGVAPVGATKFYVLYGFNLIGLGNFGYIDKAAVYEGYCGQWWAPGAARPPDRPDVVAGVAATLPARAGVTVAVP